jgi:hypothetical protein
LNACELKENLKSFSGDQQNDQDGDDVPQRGRREVEHDPHHGEGQGLQPGREEDVEEAADVGAGVDFTNQLRP